MRLFQTMLCAFMLTVAVARAETVEEVSNNGSEVSEDDETGGEVTEETESGETVANAQAGQAVQSYPQSFLPYAYLQYATQQPKMSKEQSRKILAQIQRMHQLTAAQASFAPQFPMIHPALYAHYIQQYSQLPQLAQMYQKAPQNVAQMYQQMPQHLAQMYPFPQMPMPNYMPPMPVYHQMMSQYPGSAQYPSGIIPYAG